MWRSLLYKSFHTSAHLENITSTPRQLGSAMRKLLNGERNTMPQKDVISIPRPEAFSKGSLEGKTSSNSRRSRVLNKLFMRYITDILTTNECASELAGLGIEIHRVQIAPNYKILNVFWISRAHKNYEKIEDLLKRYAGYLKGQLSQLNVMGIIPHIVFIEDKHFSRIFDLENKLSKADFGEEHVPFDLASNLKTELELFTSLDQQIKDGIKMLEEDSDISETPLPPMPNNMFSVDHADIMQRVKKSLKKSEALHRQSSTGSAEITFSDFQASQTVNENPIKFSSGRSQQEAFRKFLHDREILKTKARREKKANPYREDLKKDYSGNNMNYVEKVEFDESLKIDDYILEEEER